MKVKLNPYRDEAIDEEVGQKFGGSVNAITNFIRGKEDRQAAREKQAEEPVEEVVNETPSFMEQLGQEPVEDSFEEIAQTDYEEGIEEAKIDEEAATPTRRFGMVSEEETVAEEEVISEEELNSYLMADGNSDVAEESEEVELEEDKVIVEVTEDEVIEEVVEEQEQEEERGEGMKLITGDINITHDGVRVETKLNDNIGVDLFEVVNVVNSCEVEMLASGTNNVVITKDGVEILNIQTKLNSNDMHKVLGYLGGIDAEVVTIKDQIEQDKKNAVVKPAKATKTKAKAKTKVEVAEVAEVEAEVTEVTEPVKTKGTRAKGKAKTKTKGSK